MQPGTRLGPYEIVAQIGAGGMGEVYRARDTRLGREVAIKVLPAAFAGDLERLRRFEQEAHAASALNHPNILTVYDVGTHEGAPYLITELLEGETLRQRLIDGPLPVRKAVDAACQIARGLAAAHEKGIIHRDLKPENVFVSADGHVKILDFGIAKLLGPPGEGAQVPTVVDTTQPGMVVGTVAYMSPEHVRGLSVDQRSDIFSLGVVLYEMVTGRQAFSRDTAAETMTAILKEEPPDPTSVEAAVPAALSRAIVQCLEKSPKDRFQSAHDLALALQAAATPSRPVAAVEEARAPAGWKRSTRLLAAVGAAVLILGALAAARLWPHRGAVPRPVNFRLVSTFPGSHRFPCFSPDGSMIAYIDDVDGVPQIWVKNLATGDPIRITSGAQGATFPRWSPKNDQIIFNGLDKWGELDETQGIWSVPPLGGERRRIVDRGQNASFSWDGARIVFEREDGIWTAAANGSDPHRVEGIPADPKGIWGPVFSPDGRWIAYFRYMTEAGRIGADIWLAPTAGGRPHRLTFDVSWEGGPPVWTPDSRAIVFPSMRAGALTLWRVAVEGGAPEPVTTGAGEDNHPDISRDGRKLIYVNRRTSYALMLLDTATGDQRQLVERRDLMAISDSAFSPVGDRVAFTGGEGGSGHLFTIGTDGRELRQVTDGPGEFNAAAQWSSDGSFLYYYSASDHSYRKVPVTGARSFEMIASWDFAVQFAGQVDPEGRRIVYTAIEGGRPKATIVRDLASGRETPLPVAMVAGKWSNDGTLLLGSRETDEAFMCRPTGAPCTALGKAAGAYWSGDNSRIFFHRPGASSDVAELWVMSRDGRNQRRVAELHSVYGSSASSVSRRDQYAWVQRRVGRQELWLADLAR